MNDKVNTTERVQVSVRPFLVPLLEIAEARLAAKQSDGYTMEGMTARVLSGRLYSKAIDFDERLDYRQRAGMSQADKAIVTPEAELTAKLADVLNLAGLTALAFKQETFRERLEASKGHKEACEGGGDPATTSDSEGVPLCATCMQDTIVDNMRAELEKLAPSHVIEAMLEPVKQDVRERYPVEAERQDVTAARGGIVTHNTVRGWGPGEGVILPPHTGKAGEAMREAVKKLTAPIEADRKTMRRLGLLQQGDLTPDGQKRLAEDLAKLIPSRFPEAEHHTYPDTVLGDIDAGDGS